jgi:uncharacterized protein (TIGR00106 family)
MSAIVNVAVQVLPFSREKELYDLVDLAIQVIQSSGITYRICPFETVLEGEYDRIMDIVRECQQVCLDNGADEVLVNLKIQHRKKGDVRISDKMGKYE